MRRADPDEIEHWRTAALLAMAVLTTLAAIFFFDDAYCLPASVWRPLQVVLVVARVASLPRTMALQYCKDMVELANAPVWQVLGHMVPWIKGLCLGVEKVLFFTETHAEEADSSSTPFS